MIYMIYIIYILYIILYIYIISYIYYIIYIYILYYIYMYIIYIYIYMYIIYIYVYIYIIYRIVITEYIDTCSLAIPPDPRSQGTVSIPGIRGHWTHLGCASAPWTTNPKEPGAWPKKVVLMI